MSGYGISSTDIEASRLVFVSVKDAKPRRKVAVPVPDGANWDAFCGQVATKLKLRGVGSIYLASSGEQVLRTDDLQDIDELYVVEAQPPPVVSPSHAVGGNGAGRSSVGNSGVSPSQPQPAHYQGEGHRVGVADTEIAPAGPRDTDGDDDAKYARRNTALQRSLKRVFPSFFQPSLPVTMRDTREAGGTGAANSGRRRRRRGRLLSMRNMVAAFVLLTCLGTLFFLYSRLGARLP
mmetsp:Transcript_5962/g.17059  ORF Transcript_5962/g.17059 Transcript_5962/m.17059 type:complete len:235 (-) Transcript_5962:212-916(-)